MGMDTIPALPKVVSKSPGLAYTKAAEQTIPYTNRIARRTKSNEIPFLEVNCQLFFIFFFRFELRLPVTG